MQIPVAVLIEILRESSPIRNIVSYFHGKLPFTNMDITILGQSFRADNERSAGHHLILSLAYQVLGKRLTC